MRIFGWASVIGNALPYERERKRVPGRYTSVVALPHQPALLKAFHLANSAAEVVRLSEFATYLMTWRDLRPEHLPELRQLQADVMQHLEEIYGVQEHELADYDLQFHTTTAMRSPLFGAERGQYMTLHLQIGVRHCWTLSCMSRHMALGEVIKMLEQGGDARPAHVYCEESRMH